MPRPFTRIGQSVRALALFVVLSLAFFWQLWAPNPADQMTIGARGDDFLRQFYPYRAYVADTWASGKLPMWNSHQYAGTPTWADPQQAVVYPWRALQAPLAIGDRTLPLWSVELEAVLHVALAGWFTYLLLRRLNAKPAGAVVGGVTYAFGGYVTGYPIVQLAVLDTAVWVPATLWALAAAFDAAREQDGRSVARWTFVAAAASAMMVFAGHPQTAVYGLAAGAAWWGWSSLRAGAARRLTAAAGAGWLLLALGMSAAQWYPSWALTGRLAERFDEQDLLVGLARVDFAQMLVPGVITQWSPLFVGAAASVLVLWGLWRCRATWFWVSLAALSWLIALGGNSPVLPTMLRVVPGLDMFRHHERVAVVFSLALAVAAGLAVSRVVTAERRHQVQAAAMLLLVSALAAILAMIGTARVGLLERLLHASDEAPWRENPADALVLAALVLAMAGVVLLLRWSDRLSVKLTSVLLATIAVFELFSVNQGRALAPAMVDDADPILTALEPHKREGRVSSEALLVDGPNAASLHGLYDTTGDSPIRLQAYDDLTAATTEIERWGLLGVRYVVSDRAFPADAPVVAVVRDGDRALYETQVAAPMSWVTLAPTERERLCGPGGPSGVNETDPSRWQSWREQADTTVGEARLVGLDPGRMAVEANLQQPSSVVVSTVYDAGWQVSGYSLDDGRQLPIETCHGSGVLRAHGSLIAVHVLEPGRWQVEWTYRPFEIRLGAIVSILAWLAGVILWRPWLMRRR